jgi:hypothetical protein
MTILERLEAIDSDGIEDVVPKDEENEVTIV